MLVLTEITYCRDEQLICLGATLRWPRLTDRQTELLVGTESIAPDVLKTTNAGATEKHRSYLDRRPSGGLAAGGTF